MEVKVETVENKAGTVSDKTTETAEASKKGIEERMIGFKDEPRINLCTADGRGAGEEIEVEMQKQIGKTKEHDSKAKGSRRGYSNTLYLTVPGVADVPEQRSHVNMTDTD